MARLEGTERIVNCKILHRILENYSMTEIISGKLQWMLQYLYWYCICLVGYHRTGTSGDGGKRRWSKVTALRISGQLMHLRTKK